ncbi:MAG: DNA gyrase inhibitor YacG [Gammaproteobacteria bacterium]
MSAQGSTFRVTCPTCGSRVPWDATAVWRPFCSERCRLLDLGAWFSEERSIPVTGEPAESDAVDADPDRD